jgi:D-alanyl-D-alanine carboxypeptidase
LALCALFLMSLICPQKVLAEAFWPEGIEIESPNAIVMEESTGTILYQKNIDEQCYPASITKIMTAIIALENGDLSDTVVFSKDAVYKTEGSGIARDVGEEMTLEQCMYAMLLESANECAYAIAEHVGGTYEHFVDLMNEKAEELGCTNTHFNNPHGLPDEDHYLSAYDMALIAREAWQNETFRIMTGTVRYQIPPTNKHSEITYLQNHTIMINTYKGSDHLYEPCVGGKTGFTQAAGNTLVTYAQKNGMTLITVILHSSAPHHWDDTEALFEYCFANFGLMNIAENETRFSAFSGSVGELNDSTPYVELSTSDDVVLPLTAEFSDTEPRVVEDATEETAGRIEYSYANRIVGSADILALHPTIEPYVFHTVQEQQILTSDGNGDAEAGEARVISITPGKVLIILGIVAAALLVLFLIIKFSSRFYVLRQKFYRWKNSKSPYHSIRRKGFSMRKHHRRK